MSIDVMLAITGTTIDMIADTPAMNAESTETAGGTAETTVGTVASGENTDGANKTAHELPGCTERRQPGDFDCAAVCGSPTISYCRSNLQPSPSL